VNSISDHYSDARPNALGVLRLVFASLVIVSHAAELRDGSRANEPLTRLLGTISLGDLAVDAFFVISGFLIVRSFERSRSTAEFVVRRTARIYPAFLLAYAVAVLVVAPLGGASLPQNLQELGSVCVRAALLQPPDVGSVFAGQPYPSLNGSAWTIAYEFRCYLLVVVAGRVGLLRHRFALLTSCACLLTLAAALVVPPDSYRPDPSQLLSPELGSAEAWRFMVVGGVRNSLRLVGLFFAGCCFSAFAKSVRFTVRNDVIATILLSLGLSWFRTSHIAVALFGGYLIFRIGSVGGTRVWGRINSEHDVSYGLYLYAWPVNKLVLWWWPTMPIALVAAITFAVAYGAGWASWLCVERPCMSVARRLRWPAQRLTIGSATTASPALGADASRTRTEQG
jgi:peptidoglycan/LPS O-acetylase OafA/YrhL